MALILYGSPRSRTMRNLWALAELRLDFEHVPYDWRDPRLASAAFLALNPAGAVPLLVDDGFALPESLAINLYLCRKHGGPFWPATPQGEADAWRWSLWAQGQLEPWVQKDARLSALRMAAADEAAREVERSLATLERALASRDWLGGAAFNVADLNVAGVLSPSRSGDVDLPPRVADWLARCYARPAAVATRERYG